ncbi:MULTISPECIES: hypothetical protein [unclassified Nitrospina]|uniref:hypothetical protein n=1 Tax=unclassified Nitrospina TaxID=2638683 RepID=UPI003F9C0B68
MAEIDSNFPFNRIGLPRLGENNNDEGPVSRLRRAQEEREERREQALRTGQPTDRVNLAPRPQGEVRPVEDVVRREAETTPIPLRDLGVNRRIIGQENDEPGLVLDRNNPDDPQPFSPIEQAIAAVIRRPGNLELRPQTGGGLATEPGGEGPAARLELAPEPLVLDPARFQQQRALEDELEAPQPLDRETPPSANAQPRILEQEEPETNIQQLTENRGALRSNFLETDPALRANRELRNLIRERDDNEDTPIERGSNNLLLNEREAFVPPGAVEEPGAAPVAQSIVAERAEQARIERVEEQAEARRIRRQEEEEQRPRPLDLDPESRVAQRGLNINRFI